MSCGHTLDPDRDTLVPSFSAFHYNSYPPTRQHWLENWDGHAHWARKGEKPVLQATGNRQGTEAIRSLRHEENGSSTLSFLPALNNNRRPPRDAREGMYGEMRVRRIYVGKLERRRKQGPKPSSLGTLGCDHARRCSWWAWRSRRWVFSCPPRKCTRAPGSPRALASILASRLRAAVSTLPLLTLTRLGPHFQRARLRWP